MNPNLIVFTELCKEKNIPYRIIHDCGNLLEVKSKNGEAHLFTIGTTPFNCHSIEALCKDKEFFYNYYRDTIRMPQTKGFLNPDCNEEWKNYLKFTTKDAIIAETERDFPYPFITKMNKGSQGKCVFKVENRDEFKQALTEIYKNDYIALVQSCIDIKSEYRVIYLNKKLMFAYKKNNENATFTGNISPLHFEGAYAEIVENKNLLNAFDKFVQPMLTQKNIPYCGLDIALDKDNKMWLIEGNCSPGFGYLLQNPKGAELLKGLYTEMFKALNILPQQEHSLLMDFWNQNQQKTRV
ncbi:MAG: RimK family alpha-L-glutamate ligase [Alphaproteobacteria bacterium]